MSNVYAMHLNLIHVLLFYIISYDIIIGGEPVVNVQKLESMAPEFQNLTETVRRGAQPSSILVDKDGHPSPTKSVGGGSSHR